ncbi:hypothetical protein, partial [Neiella marina]|uniref:hypothetical protein n=1 Tax=Neiella marina TaxID=508461 RepID=UPI001E40699C
ETLEVCRCPEAVEAHYRDSSNSVKGFFNFLFRAVNYYSKHQDLRNFRIKNAQKPELSLSF